MRIFSLLMALAVLISFSNTDSIDTLYTYEDFMQQFGRTYEGEEKLQHEHIFNINYADLIKRQNEGEDMAINDFLDWNDTQKAAFFNYKPDSYEYQLSSRPLRSSNLFTSPTSFDWRSLARVTSIKNQGSCGSCWSFASTAQYESALAIDTNGTLYDLSEQYGVQCETIDSAGCNGGYPPTALKLFNKTGIPLQTAFPYQADSSYYKSRSVSICSPNSTIKLTSKITSIQHYTSLSTQEIQQDLVSYGPITVGVYASSNSFMYAGSSGLINSCGSGSVDHAILLVGYNSTHWFIKNSWGTSWGDNGFGYILKTNDCNLKTWVDLMQVDFAAPAPSPSPSPSPSPTPTPTTTTTLTIAMTDSYGDGWNGNVLALIQNGVVVAKFGSTFTNGHSQTVTATIPSQVRTQVVVSVFGDWTDQIGFTITKSDKTVVYTRSSGSRYTSSALFTAFCPTTGCPVPTTTDLYISLTDSYGDGWEGTVLGLRQNGTTTQFGSQFTSGSQYGPFKVSLLPNVKVDIIVVKLGSYTAQGGFIIRNYQGYSVFSRTAGKAFYANTVLGSFTPGAVNFAPVLDISTGKEEKVASSQTITTTPQNDKSYVGALVATTSILSAIVLVLLAVSIILGVKLVKKNNQYLETKSQSCNESEKRFTSEVENVRIERIHQK